MIQSDENEITHLALRESEERFRAVFEQAAVGIARVAPDGKWLEVNNRICEIVGYTKNELFELRFQDITYSEDLDTDLNYVRKILAGDIDTYSMEKRYIRKDKTLVWINLTVSLVREPSGEPKYFIAVVEDIDKRKSAELNLLRSERLFRGMLESIHLAGVIFDVNGKILLCNDFLLALTGWRRNDVINGDWFDIFIPTDIRETTRACFFSSQSAPRFIEYEIMTRAGERHLVAWNNTELLDTDGDFAGTASIGNDITARRQAEIELKQKQQLLSQTQSFAHIGSWSINIATNLMSLSDEAYRLYGVTVAMSPHTVESVLAHVIPEDHDRVHQWIGQFAHGEAPSDLAFSVRHTDGTLLKLNTRGTLRHNEANEPIDIIGILQDVTATSEAEEAIRESERKLRMVIDGLGPSLFVGLMTRDGVLIEANRPALAAANLKPEDVIGRPFEQTYWWSYSKTVQRQLREAVERARKGEPSRYDVAVRVAENVTIWIDFSLQPLHDDHGNVTYIVPSARVIDERKAAEQKLAEREALLSAIIDAEPAFVKLLDATGAFVEINPAGLAMIEADNKTQLDRLTFASLVVPEHKTDFEFLHKTVMAGSPATLEYDIIGLRGGRRALETHAVPLRHAAGGVHAVLGLTQDVTDRNRIIHALEDSEKRFRAIFDSVGVAVSEQDFGEIHDKLLKLHEQHKEGLRTWFNHHKDVVSGLAQQIRIVDVNPAMLALFGAESKRSLFNNLHLVYGSDSWQILRDIFLALVGGEATFSAETELLTSVGETRFVLLTLSVSQTMVPWQRVLVSHMDITEIKRYRTQLEELVAQRTVLLEAANKDLESFSYSVSHDLRTPLRSIAGFVHALQEDYRETFDEVARGYLDRVHNAALHMGNLIEALLVLGNVSRKELKQLDVDLSALAVQAIETLRAHEPERNVAVTIEPNLKTIGDPSLLGAAIDNLLNNAWKYSARKPHARIDFTVQTHGSARVYCVADNGDGFNMEHVNKLFKPFERLHTNTEFPGTGIGLATVYRIIRRHGGEVWAEAKPGEGTQIYFTLGNAQDQAKTSTTAV